MSINEAPSLAELKISPRVMDESQASAYVGMSVSFLQKARCTGPTGGRTPGPRFKKIGKRVVYDIADLDAWLDSFKSYQHIAEALADEQ